mgnify:CR=1 FL=1
MNVKSGPQQQQLCFEVALLAEPKAYFHSKLSFLEEQALTKYYMKKQCIICLKKSQLKLPQLSVMRRDRNSTIIHRGDFKKSKGLTPSALRASVA